MHPSVQRHGARHARSNFVRRVQRRIPAGYSVPFSPAYAALYAPYFSHPGTLPESLITPTGIGLTSGNILTYSPNQTVYDQSDGYTKQYSAELRFQSNFEGPFNFLFAGYYLRTSGNGDYYVPGNVIDYPGIVLGALLGGLKAPGLCGTTGCILGPSYYHNFGRNLDLELKAMFGEVYYDIIPDELKLTLGARFTDDHKSENDRIAICQRSDPDRKPERKRRRLLTLVAKDRSTSIRSRRASNSTRAWASLSTNGPDVRC